MRSFGAEAITRSDGCCPSFNFDIHAPAQRSGAPLQTPTWMPSWDRGIDRSHSLDICPQNHLIAPNSGDNSGTSPSDLFLQLRAKWQQRPETPALIRRIHTSSSHHTLSQRSDSVLPATTTPITNKEAGRPSRWRDGLARSFLHAVDLVSTCCLWGSPWQWD